MKINPLYFITFCLSLFIALQSCTSNEGVCSEEVTGIYSGKAFCDGSRDSENMTFEITRQSNNVLNIIWANKREFAVLIEGTFDPDANTITIIAGDFDSATGISPFIESTTWTLDGCTLTGQTHTIYPSGMRSMCDFTVSKGE